MSELAYVNGVFCPIADAKVSVEDRGFQFGDAVYEVAVSYDGRFFQLSEHLARLKRSAAAIRLDYDFEARPLEPIIHEGLQRSGLRDAVVYIQLTRGAAPRTHVLQTPVEPTLVMTFRPRSRLPEELRRRGAHVITITDERWANCYVKAVTLLPNVLARYQAIDRGCDDAVFVSPAGEVRECTAANIFVVRGQRILTPPRTDAVLHGITQRFVMSCAEALGFAVEESHLFVPDLLSAAEVFMSSTTAEILGITMIDGKPVGDGKVGPITTQVHAEFVRRTRPEKAAPRSRAAC